MKFRRTGNQEHYDKFSDLRKIVKTEIKTAYNNYILNIEDRIKVDPVEFWKFVKTKSKIHNKFPIMRLGGVELNNGQEIVNAFKDYFSSTYASYGHNPPNAASAICGSVLPGADHLSVNSITENEVYRTIKSLKSKFTTGPDLLPQYLLKAYPEVFAPPLTYIFNLCISTCKFPEIWKISKVVPIPKTTDPTIIEQHRPISVLSIPAKIFDKVMYSRINLHMKKYVTTFQHGFTNGRSIETNLINYVNYINRGIDNSKQTDAIYLDLTKAFDRVDHSILLNKLNYYGFSDKLIIFFASYLTSRKQYVTFRGFRSDTYVIESGVPQGSNIGPCLFILLINDICKIIEKSHFLLFADDLKIFKHVNAIADAVDIQSDLNNLVQWCQLNKMELNIKKCSSITFTRSKNARMFEYSVSNTPLPRATEIKDLGIILDSGLTFKPHIDKIIKASYRTLGFIMRNGKSFRNMETRMTLYQTLVRSRLEFGAVVWDSLRTLMPLKRFKNVS